MYNSSKTEVNQVERASKIWVNVGITGKRLIPAEMQARINGQLRTILQTISSHTQSILSEKSKLFEALGYSHIPGLSLISSLAEGADRMAAHAALDCGYTLQCPLPMSEEKYKKTFEPVPADQKDEFDDLLNKAERVFEIAQCNDNSSQAYADASRVMLNHSDILISIWDGKTTKYIAGTHSTMQQARKQHIPIIYIPLEKEKNASISMTLQ